MKVVISQTYNVYEILQQHIADLNYYRLHFRGEIVFNVKLCDSKYLRRDLLLKLIYSNFLTMYLCIWVLNIVYLSGSMRKLQLFISVFFID